MRLDPNVTLSELTSVDKMLETIKASEQAKTALTSELAEVNSALEAAKTENEQNVAKVVELEAKVTELEARSAAIEEANAKIAALEAEKEELAAAKAELEANVPDAETQAAANAALVSEAVAEALEVAKVEHVAALAELQSQLDTIKAEVTESVEAAEAATVAAEALKTQTDTVAEALGLKGEISTELASEQDVNKTAAIVARYQALSTSIYPAQKAEARRIYAEHKQAIVDFLDARSGTNSAPVNEQSGSTITEEQWALYNSWLADRTTLTSNVSRLSTEEKTNLHVKHRRTYSANKQLFDRCMAARSVKQN